MQYYVNKSTDTVADLYLAYGFLQLIAKITPDDTPLNPTLRDDGWSYLITLNKPLQPEWFERHEYPIRLNHFIQTASKTAVQRPPYIIPMDSVEYDYEKGKYDGWRDAYWKLSGKDRHSGSVENLLLEQGIERHNPDFPVWALINQQKAIKSYNKIVMTWHQHRGEAFAGLLRIIFDLFANPINDIDYAQGQWREVAVAHGLEVNVTETATQIINPGVGKGSHNSKMTGVKEGNLDNFWLMDYLRYAGMYTAGIPLVVQGGSDRKTYLPVPNQLTWNMASQRVFTIFRDKMTASTPIKLDILSVFRYAAAYLDQWVEAQKRSKGFGLSKGSPSDHARAIAVVSLKDMGSGHAVMGMNELNIPEWVQIETPADGARFQEIIKEHQSVVISLDEKHSDEHSLLRDYRRFLSTGELSTFLEFTRGFSGVTMSRLNEGSYAPQFTLPYLQEVLMAVRPDITPILQDSGFRAVAEAIRRSTVVPLVRQSRKQENLYDVRYGLGDKLMRASLDRNRFVRELTDFMFRYNQETAQVSASRKVQAFRSAITMEDVEAVAALIDTCKDCQLIAGLLVAYGYARDPEMGKHEKQDQTQGEE